MAVGRAQAGARTLAEAQVLFLPSPGAGPGVDHSIPAGAVLVAKTAVASSQRLEVFLAAAPCRGRGGGREGKGCAHVCARRGHSDITALPRDNPSLDLCPSPAISASPARQRAARLGPARSRHTEREGKGLSGSERPSETVLGETRYVSAPSQCQVSTTGDPPPPAEVTPEAPRLGGGRPGPVCLHHVPAWRPRCHCPRFCLTRPRRALTSVLMLLTLSSSAMIRL